MGLFFNRKKEFNIDKESTLAITGHRPKSLPWGYNEEHPACIEFKKELRTVIEGAINYGFRHFVSGLAEGVDMMFAEIIIDIKKTNKDITLEGAIPCPNQDYRWSESSKKRYKNIVKQCDFTTLVSDTPSKECFNKRNYYMVDKSSVIIAVWNGKPSGTGNTVRYAKEHGVKVRRINPEDFI